MYKRIRSLALTILLLGGAACGGPGGQGQASDDARNSGAAAESTSDRVQCDEMVLSLEGEYDVPTAEDASTRPNTPEAAVNLFLHSHEALREIPKEKFKKKSAEDENLMKKGDEVKFEAHDDGKLKAVLDATNLGLDVWAVESADICQDFIDKMKASDVQD